MLGPSLVEGADSKPARKVQRWRQVTVYRETVYRVAVRRGVAGVIRVHQESSPCW